MTNDILYVFGVAIAAGALFVSGKMRLDMVALLVVLSLVLGDILTPTEALAGFGQPVVIMVAGLFVISGMLTRTGVAQQIGNWLAKYGGSGEARLLLLLIMVVAALGSFMSNTAVVAIFIPVVLSLANTTNLNASRLLMPLAYAGIVSGMMTLISTTSNLVISAELASAGFEPLGLFSITPIGLVVLAVLALYMLLFGRHLLPGGPVEPPKTMARSMRDLLDEFEVAGTVFRMKVPVGSSLVGQTLAGTELGSRYDLRVIIVDRSSRLNAGITPAPSPELEIQTGDILVVQGTREAVEQVLRDHELLLLSISDQDRVRWMQETGIGKVLIHPESKLIGNTLGKIDLRRSYGVQVLAFKRKNEILNELVEKEIKRDDALLVIGPWHRIRKLQQELHDFVVLALPSEIEQVAPSWRRAPIALAILVLMVSLTAFKIVPIAISVTICALLAVVAKCLTMEQAYAGIHWSSVVLVAGMMSIAAAFSKTGAIELIVGQLMDSVGGAGPYAMLITLFVLTALLSMVLSAAPTAILLAPIAIKIAAVMDVSPYGFGITVAIAATAGFLSPVSSSAVMLVVGPGKYRQIDFLKVGIPLLILTGIITIIMTPILFPFKP